jgi:phosphoribosylformimino-5-aminoimidazole carboxamide ribotide isomerase
MIAMPAIDLRDGACVQLEGGSYDRERVRLPDPSAVARGWWSFGFRHLHVVDLDAATDRVAANNDIVVRLLREWKGDVQIGGGVRSEGRAKALLAQGAARVVAGTRALEDSAWLEATARATDGRMIAAVDVRDSKPVVRGWSRPVPRSVDEVLADLNPIPLAGVLVTSVDVEGTLAGPDLSLIERVLAATTHPVIAAGGITTLDQMRALASLGVWAAVIGMALYTGDMDAARCAEEFGA